MSGTTNTLDAHFDDEIAVLRMSMCVLRNRRRRKPDLKRLEKKSKGSQQVSQKSKVHGAGRPQSFDFNDPLPSPTTESAKYPVRSKVNGINERETLHESDTNGVVAYEASAKSKTKGTSGCTPPLVVDTNGNDEHVVPTEPKIQDETLCFVLERLERMMKTLQKFGDSLLAMNERVRSVQDDNSSSKFHKIENHLAGVSISLSKLHKKEEMVEENPAVLNKLEKIEESLAQVKNRLEVSEDAALKHYQEIEKDLYRLDMSLYKADVRMDTSSDNASKNFEEMGKKFDQMTISLGKLNERMEAIEKDPQKPVIPDQGQRSTSKNASSKTCETDHTQAAFPQNIAKSHAATVPAPAAPVAAAPKASVLPSTSRPPVFLKAATKATQSQPCAVSGQNSSGSSQQTSGRSQSGTTKAAVTINSKTQPNSKQSKLTDRFAEWMASVTYVPAIPMSSATRQFLNSFRPDFDQILFFSPTNWYVGFLSQSYMPSGYFQDPELDPKIHFRTAEHYVQWKKAMLFGDSEKGWKILYAEQPADANDLGHQVKNFNHNEWHRRTVKRQIVLRANRLKFTRSVEAAAIRQALLNTGSRELIFASPYNPHMGIGINVAEASDDLQDGDRSFWGSNILGKVLMQLRQELRSKKK
ncbi:hypothetical protein F5Y16DRAFT_419590 [Xylariaceae sp. FL0255]|nr:hypothetical protein F5Y16DRAFT_419590 [Xylariaceae sp. FL0255]